MYSAVLILWGVDRMKTMQELYSEIAASDELKGALVEAMKANKVEDFLKAHGCEATPEEVQEFIEDKAAGDDPIELSEDELRYVVGGSFVDSVECSHKGNTCNCSNTCIRDCC